MKILIAVAILALSGCSTMFNSGSQPISLRPDSPDGDGISVEVRQSGTYFSAKLPTTIDVSPGWKEVSVQVSEKCFEQRPVQVQRSVSGTYWLNIFNGGWGFILDAATGTMWSYDNAVRVPIKKIDGCSDHASVTDTKTDS